MYHVSIDNLTIILEIIMKRFCVFCGSSPGARPEYLETARQLGQCLVENNIGLVYGGGNVGMMGEIAHIVMQHGGNVTGVIPRFLAEKEVVLEDVTELHIVDSMHERKALMAELSDGFIAMPGGFGTIEEIFEVFTWAQLGLHEKPCGFLNICGYYDAMLTFLHHAIEEQFIKAEYRGIVLLGNDSQSLLEKFKAYQPVKVDKAKWALGLKNS